MSTEQNKTLVRRYLEQGWGSGDLSVLRDVVSQDFCDENPAPGQPCGFEGQEWAIRTFRQGLSNISLRVDDLFGQDDRVVDRWTFSGTQTGEFMGLPATGRKFTMNGIDECRIENGKIAEVWHVEDILGMMRQLGAAPAPPQQPQSYGRPSTGSGTGYGTQPSDEDRKARLRRGFQDLIERGDLNRIPEYLAPDFVGHFSATPPVYGHDGFREFISIYTNGLSERRVEIHDLLIDGDKAFCRVTYHGKNTGTMMGMSPTGKTAKTNAMAIFRFSGDKVVEQWGNNDDMGMLQQLGVIPVQAGMTAPVPC
ncbi:MAG TPA: ester cyclase [Anaerolineae bacterium]